MKRLVWGTAVCVCWFFFLYFVGLYLLVPHEFWYRVTKVLQGTALKVGNAGLAAEHAYSVAMERERLL